MAAGAAVNVETIMDSLNSDGSGTLALEPLCQAAARELLMRSYTIRTLNRYKRVWEQLADFARAQGRARAEHHHPASGHGSVFFVPNYIPSARTTGGDFGGKLQRLAAVDR